MKKLIAIYVCIAICSLAMAQTVADFENFDLSVGEFINNSLPAAGFSSGSIWVPNNYNENYASWSGWAISSATDTLTPGFMNQYSVISGSGADSTNTYALAFIFSPTVMRLTGDAVEKVVEGMYINNGTYNYWSMLEGDSFAKRFGGETGDDPDYYKLTIRKYFEDTLSEDSVVFYLADYRFEDNTQDYIVKDWTWVDLTSLGNVDSLRFELASSDIGNHGINTPTYFFVDQVVTRDISTDLEEIRNDYMYTIYPNPTQDYLMIDWEENHGAEASILNIDGRLCRKSRIMTDKNQLDVSDLANGVYVLRIESERKVVFRKFVKKAD